jgi:hypothetical protein
MNEQEKAKRLVQANPGTRLVWLGADGNLSIGAEVIAWWVILESPDDSVDAEVVAVTVSGAEWDYYGIANAGGLVTLVTGETFESLRFASAFVREREKQRAKGGAA